MVNIKELIDEIINEMEQGKVKSDMILLMKMHSKYSLDYELTPVLNLENKELLYSEIEKYILNFKNKIFILSVEEQREYLKRIIALLFADMSINDFNDPVLYVQRKNDFINNKLLEDKTIDSIFFESQIVMEIKPYSKETPYCFESMLVNEECYKLPTISYGISNDTCYIYTIQDYNKHEKTSFHQKIKRKLYKLNNGVYDSETLEYREYKENKSDYYPENISDVSPSFILVLTLFLNEIYKKGITKVKVVPYLPIRYENKIKVLAKKVLIASKKENLSEIEKQKMYLNLINEQRYYQSNMTEKFIRCFYRMAYHFENISITSLPFELDDSLHITLDEFKYSDSEILNEIIKESNKNLSK